MDEIYSFRYPVGTADLAFYLGATARNAARGPVSDEEIAAMRLARSLGRTSNFRMQTLDDPEPPGGDDSGGDDPAPDVAAGFSGYASNALWIAAIDVNTTNWIANLVLTNTETDVLYEILSKSALTNEAWITEGTVLGLDNSTPVTISLGTRTNQLFFWARSWIDQDLNEIPDWWERQYFGTNGIDPYLRLNGDGWTVLDAFLHGWDPRVSHTLQAPTGLEARYSWSLTNPLVTWNPALDPVSYYVLERYVPELDEAAYFTNTGTSFQDTTFPELLPDFTWGAPGYRVYAHYAGGDSPWSDPVQVFRVGKGVYGSLVRGPGGALYLAAPAIPATATAIRLMRYDYESHYPDIWLRTYDIPAASFTNGVYPLPDSWGVAFDQATRDWYTQAIDKNGDASEPVGAGYPRTIPFFDSREALSQNLNFLLRAANTAYPFSFGWAGSTPYVALFKNPTNYAYSGLYTLADTLGGTNYVQEFDPFVLNYLYRNFVFNQNDVDGNGKLNTGRNILTISPSWAGKIEFPSRYLFGIPTSSTTLSTVLSSNVSQFSSFYPDSSDENAEDWPLIGLELDSSSFLSMDYNVSNFFGLAFVSTTLAWGSNSTQKALLTPGASSLQTHGLWLYSQAAWPQLQTSRYYFASLSPAFPVYLPGQAEPVPGMASFSITNNTKLIVAAVGQDDFRLAGFSERTILNGAANKPAYLGQYFDKAYKIGTNGVATTNETGILSPYGEFFPMEPGAAALITMTNWGVNERGTAVVQVISINVDANRDGVMDLSFGGPDQVTPSQPFHFWVNDNDDKGDEGGSGIPEQGPRADTIPGSSFDNIQGTRDLVDFFPIHLSIGSLFQSNALSAGISPFDPAYVFVLKQADTALYFLETDLARTNFMDYLRTTNFLASISSPCHVITPGGIILGTNLLAKIRDGRGILLIEASKPTTAPLVLEVRRGTNVIASCSLALSIDGVEKMFRHKNLIATTFPKSNSLEAPRDRLRDADVPNEPDTTEKSFVFVHGYNVNPMQARGYAADVFKRLYWSGSHAKFYAVTWFGSDTQGNVVSEVTCNYHTNVCHAFETATNLATFLATLTNGPNTVAAHSLGNMVVLSALSDHNALMSNYFMIDAAIPIEAIEGDVSETNAMLFADWSGYANRLHARAWHALFPTNDARSTLSWTNRLANLRNADVYNFYSSGEEVLRQYNDDPPADLFSALPGQIGGLIRGARGAFTWVWQEKGKGRASYNSFLGSNHGGWKFNDNSYGTNTPSGIVHMSRPNAALLPDAQLRTNSFFSTVSDPLEFGNFAADAALLGANGSNYAQTNRNRILSDAIPALTLPVGANSVSSLDTRAGATRNFDMGALFENGWPSGRMQAAETNNWHHSDFRRVAYPYTYMVFTNFVFSGNLK
jgi:hypothetical protein